MPHGSFRAESPSSGSVEWAVPLAAPFFTEEEVRAAVETLQSGWWTYGPVARRLEEEFADSAGVSHAIAVSSGTAALQLAMAALGLKPGEEVLTPSLNFVAAANAIVHGGGIPRFVDVESAERPLVSVRTLAEAVTDRSRGVCVTHYAGFPCEMDSIMEFARRRSLWVIEDAAHAPGGTWKGIPCGAWGDAGCFSFFGNKNITCGEGGMVVTSRDDVAGRIRSLRSHGMDSLTWDRYRGHRHSYDVKVAGFNFRMDDLRASILRRQLRSLDRINRLRAERADWYGRLLPAGGPWTVPFAHHEGTSAHHLFVIVLDAGAQRDHVIGALRRDGIQTSVHYPPTHEFSFYRDLGLSTSGLRVTEQLGGRLLTLPLYPDMAIEQVERVCEALGRAVESQRSGRSKE